MTPVTPPVVHAKGGFRVKGPDLNDVQARGRRIVCKEGAHQQAVLSKGNGTRCSIRPSKER